MYSTYPAYQIRINTYSAMYQPPLQIRWIRIVQLGLYAAEVNLNVHVRRRRELSAPDAWMRICACGSCELHACGAVIRTGPKS